MIYTVKNKVGKIKEVDNDYELKKGESWHIYNGKDVSQCKVKVIK